MGFSKGRPTAARDALVLHRSTANDMTEIQGTASSGASRPGALRFRDKRA